MSNRVEDLESKVKELQAAVNGLTEELVETKERVRQLEDEVEVDVAPRRSRQVEQQSADVTTDAAAEEEQVEDAKADDANEEDNEEKSSGSDIIVA